MIRIAVIDDEATARRMIKRFLEQAGFEVEVFNAGEPFLVRMQENPFDIVFVDMQLPGISGMDVLHQLRLTSPETEAIIVTGHGSIENAVEATKEGAFYYLTKPCRKHDICLMAERAAEKVRLRQENKALRGTMDQHCLIPGFIGNSKSMRAIFETIRKVAQVNCNVLLEAETGTGKQLTARAIHELGPRKKCPFVYFNCGGFTEELICSELFGHEKGSFTGAVSTKIGLFESASGGTVLLDEIGEMSLSMQVKLLHVLQERQLLRVGGTRPIDLNIRIIAATNRDLQEQIREGLFREDLYYRLNVVSIHLPRLVERREDIPLLVQHFIEKSNRAFEKKIKGITPEALNLLMQYHFPGNIRELENIIQHAVALTESDKLTARDLPPHLLELAWDDILVQEMLPLDEMEKRYIKKVLKKTGYNMKAASKILKMSRTTLWRRMKKYGLTSGATTDQDSSH
ncbi:sigma-54-dependent transcriptional regulator [Desulfolithobacter sp.]